LRKNNRHSNFKKLFFIKNSLDRVQKILKSKSIKLFFSKIEKLKPLFFTENSSFYKKWSTSLNLYQLIFFSPIWDGLLTLKSLSKSLIFKKFYRLFFTFRNRRFFVNLTNFNQSKNYLFLSTGMFIQYFQYKRSLRKNKLLKIIIAKYLRKFFLILQLKYISIHFNSTPLLLQELITNITTPLIKPLKNPLTHKVIDEDHVSSSQPRFLFLFFFFQKSKNFGIHKFKRKGRIKRRILRKLIKMNNVLY